MGLYWKSQPVLEKISIMELEFESGLWVKTIHNFGSEYSMETIKHVIDSNQNNTEISADPQEDQVPQTGTKVVPARSKAKAKPEPREPVDTSTIRSMHERRWIDIEPSEQTFSAFDLSKKVICLLRQSNSRTKKKVGAIEVWRIEFYLRKHSSQVQHWSDDRWKVCSAAGGGSKRRYNYCFDDLGTIIYLRAFRRHSGNNLIDPTLQDNVVIESGIFHDNYHIDVHSIFTLLSTMD